VLTQRGLLWDTSGLHSEVLGVVLQQLWIVGLWALLLAARVGRITRGLVMVTVLASDVAIVNGFFVWPKLLPAAFLLAAAALMVTPLWEDLRGDLHGAALLASLLGLALLGHGASVFAVIPLIAVAALRGLPDRRWIGVAAVVTVALLAPWSAYQKYGDPPGNRLTKWMLGGARVVDGRGTAEAIVEGYREAGLGGTLANKERNAVTILGGKPALDRGRVVFDSVADDDLDKAVRELRELFFFQLLPSLGLLLVALVVTGVGRIRARPRSAEWHFSLTCWAIVLVGCVVWSLLLFGSPQANASIHVGSLAIPVLAFCAAIAGLRATFPRFAIWYACAAALLMLLLYVPSLDPPSATSYSLPAGVLVATFLAGFAGLAFRAGRASAGPNTLAR
jgi:hypothetical protein